MLGKLQREIFGLLPPKIQLSLAYIKVSQQALHKQLLWFLGSLSKASDLLWKLSSLAMLPTNCHPHYFPDYVCLQGSTLIFIVWKMPKGQHRAFSKYATVKQRPCPCPVGLKYGWPFPKQDKSSPSHTLRIHQSPRSCAKGKNKQKPLKCLSYQCYPDISVYL